MSHAIPPAPREPFRAYDSVIVELRTVHREPRMVFDELTRTAFEACAALADAVFDDCLRDIPGHEDARIRCLLDPEGPGIYQLGFEVPLLPEPAEARTPLGRFLHPRARRPSSPEPDPLLQGELLTATHIVEDLLLCVDTICSTPPGRLSVCGGDDPRDEPIEFVDGVRVLRRTNSSTWGLLVRQEILELLRRVLAPFQDPELYTMNVRGQSPYGSLCSNWTITASEPLRRFVTGGRLELPAREPSAAAPRLVG